MAELTVQSISLSGVTPSYESAAAGGDTFANNGKVLLHVKNGSGSDVDVTITATGSYLGVDLEDLTITVGAGSEELIGPFPANAFNSAGVVAVGYSAVTSVTVAALQYS